MNLSSHPLREEGMQESGPCNPTGRVSVSHGSVPDSDPGLSGHLASPFLMQSYVIVGCRWLKLVGVVVVSLLR